MTTKIIFLCPHNAAKSITAAAFLQREAIQRHLDVEITTAGTDPDTDIVPLVRTHLEAEGLTIDEPPTQVSTSDLSNADLIINIGCPHDLLPTVNAIEDWFVPDFSADPQAAFDAIEAHVVSLSAQIIGASDPPR